MAAVALYIASSKLYVPAAELLIRTAKNPNYRNWPYALTFGHTWLVLGTEGARYCVDPWAGVWCEEEKLQAEFLEKMQLWQGSGKRTAVFWRGLCSRESAWWTYPTNGAIAALFAADRMLVDNGANDSIS